MDASQNVESRVRGALSTALAGRVDVGELGVRDDLFGAGMTSHQTVQVMLALEDEFDVEFPDDQLSKTTFATISSIVSAVDSLA